MSMLDNYRPEDITPSMRKYFGMPEVAKDEGTSEGAKKGWETRRHGGVGAESEEDVHTDSISRMTDVFNKAGIDVSKIHFEDVAIGQPGETTATVATLGEGPNSVLEAEMDHNTGDIIYRYHDTNRRQELYHTYDLKDALQFFFNQDGGIVRSKLPIDYSEI